MSLHHFLNRHEPDLRNSRWEGARFVTSCLICGREMVKPAGRAWEIVKALG